MTSDPIADMLTRVRNAIAARHPKVDVPASKLKTEIARIMKEEGYIANFKVAEDGPKSVIKIYLKYSNDGYHAPEARFAPRLPLLCWAGRYPACSGWLGYQYFDHPARCHDRPPRP